MRLRKIFFGRKDKKEEVIYLVCCYLIIVGKYYVNAEHFAVERLFDFCVAFSHFIYSFSIVLPSCLAERAGGQG